MARDTRGGACRRGIGAAAALTAIVVLAAGCGGATKAATSATTSAAATGSHASPFCQASRALENREEAEEKSLLDTPASVEKAEDEAVADLPEFQRLAPPSLKSAVSILVTEDRLIFTDLQAVGFNYAQLTQSANKTLQSPQFTEADDQITSYLTHVCGISANS